MNANLGRKNIMSKVASFYMKKVYIFENFDYLII